MFVALLGVGLFMHPRTTRLLRRKAVTVFPLKRYCHAYSCAATARINMQAPPDQLYSLLHAGDANSKDEAGRLFLALPTDRSAVATIADFQRKIRVAINSYLGLLTSRMALDVGEALLYHSE